MKICNISHERKILYSLAPAPTSRNGRQRILHIIHGRRVSIIDMRECLMLSLSYALSYHEYMEDSLFFWMGVEERQPLSFVSIVSIIFIMLLLV